MSRFFDDLALLCLVASAMLFIVRFAHLAVIPVWVCLAPLGVVIAIPAAALAAGAFGFLALVLQRFGSR